MLTEPRAEDTLRVLVARDRFGDFGDPAGRASASPGLWVSWCCGLSSIGRDGSGRAVSETFRLKEGDSAPVLRGDTSVGLASE